MEMKITKEDFQDYEDVRIEGKTNMFITRNVVNLSNNLTREKVVEIIKNYDKYNILFSIKVKRRI